VVDADIDPTAIRGEVIDAVGMACSVSGPAVKKLWSSTRTGSPLGRHSRPAAGNCPSCSFFFASTLMTGSPASWWALTCSLM